MISPQHNQTDALVAAHPVQGLPLFARLACLDSLLNLRLLP